MGYSNEGYMPGKKLIRNPETGEITEVVIPTDCEQEEIDCYRNTWPKRFKKDANGVEKKVLGDNEGGFKPELFYKFENELLNRTFPNLTFYKIEMPHSWGIATEYVARVKDTLYYLPEFNKLIPHSNHNWKDICQSYLFIYFLRAEFGTPSKKKNCTFTDYFEHVLENDEKGFPGMEHYILEINLDTAVQQVRFYLKNNKIYHVTDYGDYLDMSENLTREVQSYGITLTYSNSIDKYTESDGYSYVVVSRNNTLTNQKITFTVTGLTSGSNYKLKLLNLKYSQEVVVSSSFQVNSSNVAVVEWTPPVSATGIFIVRLYPSNSNTYIYQMPNPIVLENIKTGTLYSGMNYKLKYCDQFFRNHTGGTSQANITSYINKVLSALRTSYNFEVSTHALGTVTDPDNEIELFINDYKLGDVFKFHNTESTSAGVHPGSSNKYITLQSCFYQVTSPNMTVYPTEESFLLSAMAHEFLHLIQFTYAGNNTISDRLKWIKEGQPRFIQTVINLADEFNNTGLYLQEVNKYLAEDISNYSSQHLYSLSYKYAIFWRFLFEKTGSLSVMKKAMVNALNNNDNVTIGKCMSYMNNALNSSSLFNMETALNEYAKNLFFIKQPGYWNPNNNYTDSKKLQTTNIGTSSNNTINATLLNTYAINLHSLEFATTGSKKITFECANNNFWVKVFKYADNNSVTIIDRDLALISGDNSCDININTNEKIAVIVIRNDNTEDPNHNQSSWSAYKIKISPSNLPVANFTANPTTINEGETVTFTNLTDNCPTCTVQFDYGDGSQPILITSTIPPRTYNIAKVYNSKLTVNNGFGTDSKTIPITVDCEQYKSTTTDIFTADNTQITVGESVNFSTLVSGGLSYSWKFDTGVSGIIYSNQPNPSVVYNYPGVFSVELSMRTTTGCYYQKKNSYITVEENNTVNSISVNCSYTSNGAKTITAFADVAGGSGWYTYNFTFSDGTSNTITGSFSESVTHTFSYYGNHSFSVMIIDMANTYNTGNCYEAIYLPDPDPCSYLIANFSISPSTIVPNQAYSITDLTNVGSLQYTWCWYFLDDPYSSTYNENGLHHECINGYFHDSGLPTSLPNYTQPGKYLISLNVWDSNGCYDEKTNEIEVIDPEKCISNLRIESSLNSNTEIIANSSGSCFHSFSANYTNNNCQNPYNGYCGGYPFVNDVVGSIWYLNGQPLSEGFVYNEGGLGSNGTVWSPLIPHLSPLNNPHKLKVRVDNPCAANSGFDYWAEKEITIIVLDCDYNVVANSYSALFTNPYVYNTFFNGQYFFYSGKFMLDGNDYLKTITTNGSSTFTACKEITLSDGFEFSSGVYGVREFTAKVSEFQRCTQTKNFMIYNTCESLASENLLIATPNPFITYTNILMSLQEDGLTNLSIYDINGKLVKTLINTRKEAGNYEVIFWAGDIADGVYVCKLIHNNKLYSLKLIKGSNKL